MQILIFILAVFFLVGEGMAKTKKVVFNQETQEIKIPENIRPGDILQVTVSSIRPFSVKIKIDEQEVSTPSNPFFIETEKSADPFSSVFLSKKSKSFPSSSADSTSDEAKDSIKVAPISDEDKKKLKEEIEKDLRSKLSKIEKDIKTLPSENDFENIINEFWKEVCESWETISPKAIWERSYKSRVSKLGDLKRNASVLFSYTKRALDSNKKKWESAVPDGNFEEDFVEALYPFEETKTLLIKSSKGISAANKLETKTLLALNTKSSSFPIKRNTEEVIVSITFSLDDFYTGTKKEFERIFVIPIKSHFSFFVSTGWGLSDVGDRHYERALKVRHITNEETEEVTTETFSTFKILSESPDFANFPMLMVNVVFDDLELFNIKPALGVGVIQRSVNLKSETEAILGLSFTMSNKFSITFGWHPTAKREILLLSEEDLQNLPDTITRESAVGTESRSSFVLGASFSF